MKDLTKIAEQLRSLRDERKTYHPSPNTWEDQILYFLMLDRFSDGNEASFLDINNNPISLGQTPPYHLVPPNGFNSQNWENAGGKFCGGTLSGLESKLGYLKRLGVTALWISPIFKQIATRETYHGYGIQDFLDVDPRFGTKADLKRLVDTAHKHGIFVILDIILNHSGDVFEYYPDRDNISLPYQPYDGRNYYPRGFRDASGAATLKFGPVPLTEWPDGAIWPQELQYEGTFECKGRINNWDAYPEYIEGDFFDLKDFSLGQGTADEMVNDFRPSPTLRHLADCYRYWMAFADVDGFRIDTVKHMPTGATRFFASVIEEFAQVLGKERFYLIGEITGGRANAFNTMQITGLDAALGIDDIQEKIDNTVKGYCNPEEYFDLFRNSDTFGRSSHTWLRNHVVTMIDDHDQVRRGNNKGRFCSWGEGADLMLNALAFNVLTLGIPCIYYGSEQQFDGSGPSDKYIRECMFGGEFGAFKSSNRHFFNESSPTYRELGVIIGIRSRHLALTRGRQYLREISGDGEHFGLPRKIGDGRITSLVAWSRIHSSEEILVAINTDTQNAQSAWVTVDSTQSNAPATWQQLYPVTPNGNTITSQQRNGLAVQLTVQPAGIVIYRRLPK